MVIRNSLVQSTGNVSDRVTRPEKILFSIGDYDVSFHTQDKATGLWNYYKCAIWHNKRLIGGIDLSTAYNDVKTVVSVNSNINEAYQGLGIGYRTYEGLACEVNMALQSANQSEGAVKLWRKFATNDRLRLYFVEDITNENLFCCDIHEVTLNPDGVLEGKDYTGTKLNPYTRGGSLLLVKRKGALDKQIQKYIPLRHGQRRIAMAFRRYDDLHQVIV